MDVANNASQWWLIGLVLPVSIVAVGVLFIVALVKCFTRKTASWIITTVLSFIVGLGLLGVLMVSVVNNISGLAEKANDLSKNLSSKDGMYSITVPGSWRPAPELNPVAVITGANKIREQYVLVIVDDKQDIDMTLPEFSKVTSEQLLQSLTEVVSGNPENATVAGYPAIIRKFAGKSDAVRAVFRHVSIETPDALCQVLCWTIPSKEKVSFPIFEKVAESFKIKAVATKSAAPKKLDENASTDEKVRLALAEQFGKPVASIEPSLRLKEDLGADDLDEIEYVMALEEVFDVSIPDEVSRKWVTVADIIKHIESQVKK